MRLLMFLFITLRQSFRYGIAIDRNKREWPNRKGLDTGWSMLFKLQNALWFLADRRSKAVAGQFNEICRPNMHKNNDSKG
jgi:hypothetical protein